MSIPSLNEQQSPAVGADADVQSRNRNSVLGQLTSGHALRPLKALAFWSAITMPFLYLPLLFYGLETTQEVAVFLTLLGINVVALVIGHHHARD